MVQLYCKVGFTEQILDYFSGPAFLAWQRMGNIKKWALPLSESWCLAQCDFQINILTRSRQLGMLSVLPGFTGHVPDASVTLYIPWTRVYSNYSNQSINIIRTLKSPVLGVVLYIQIRQTVF